VILANPVVVLRLLAPLLVFFLVTATLALWLSRTAGFDYPECSSVCLATLARNSPVVLAIAVVASPDRPLIGLALAAGPLIELPRTGTAARGPAPA
jgi:arsenite transporter